MLLYNIIIRYCIIYNTPNFKSFEKQHLHKNANPKIIIAHKYQYSINIPHNLKSKYIE